MLHHVVCNSALRRLLLFLLLLQWSGFLQRKPLGVKRGGSLFSTVRSFF